MASLLCSLDSLLRLRWRRCARAHLLRHPVTGLYVAPDAVWTREPAGAVRFASRGQAAAFATRFLCEPAAFELVPADGTSAGLAAA